MAEAHRIRSFLGIFAVLAVLLVAAYLIFSPTSAPTLPPPPPLPELPAAPKPAVPAGPQFDVVRVDSAGNAVIAGRADPGATVTIKNGDTTLGTAAADASGAFVFLPPNPLQAGAQQLSLSEVLPDGQVVQGETSAAIDVASNASGQSLTVITGSNGSKIISGQGPLPGSLGMGAVDYDANGHALFSGTAHAGDKVAVSLNGAALGTATAGQDGRWTLTTNVPKTSGTLLLSDSSDSSKTPIGAPFALETLKSALAQGNIVIEPGQNLWVIARHLYGRGTLYTLIYKANATIIHDPNLIFPGQAFNIPKQG